MTNDAESTNLPVPLNKDSGDFVRERMMKLLPVAQALRLYHRHEVVGLENVPPSGRCLLVTNHSLATYDIALLYAAIFLGNGRVTRPLIDRLFFRVPMVGPIMEFFGSTQGNQENARSLLAGENIVAVAPGGMREALRPSVERYQIRWNNRKGFVRLAMETGTPIILGACPRADDIYEVYPNPITKWAYKAFKVPLFVARGVGLSPVPRPVKLVHYLSEPLIPPKPVQDPEAFKRQVSRFHSKVCKRMELLIGEAIAHRV